MNKGKTMIRLKVIFLLLIASEKILTQNEESLGFYEKDNKYAKSIIKGDYKDLYLVSNWANFSLEISHNFENPDSKSFITSSFPDKSDKSRELIECDDAQNCSGVQIFDISTENEKSIFKVVQFKFSLDQGYEVIKNAYIQESDPGKIIPNTAKISFFEKSSKNNGFNLVLTTKNKNINTFNIVKVDISQELVIKTTFFENVQISEFLDSSDQLITRGYEIDQGYMLVYKVDLESGGRVNRTKDSRKQSKVYILRFSDKKSFEFDLSDFSNFEKNIFIESATLTYKNGNLGIVFSEFFELKGGIVDLKITNLDEKKIEKVDNKIEENSLLLVLSGKTEETYQKFTFKADKENKKSTIVFENSDEFNIGDVTFTNEFDISQNFVKISNSKSKMEIPIYTSEGQKTTFNLPIYTKISSEILFYSHKNFLILNENGINQFIQPPSSYFNLNLDTNLPENENPEKNLKLFSPGNMGKNYKYYVFNERNFKNMIKNHKAKIIKGGLISPYTSFKNILNTNFANIAQTYSMSEKEGAIKIPKIDFTVKLNGLNSIIGSKNQKFLQKIIIDEKSLLTISENSVKFFKNGGITFQSNFNFPIRKILDFKMSKTYLALLYKTEGGRLSVVEIDLFAQNIFNNVYFELSTELAKLRFIMKEKITGTEIDVKNLQLFFLDQAKNTVKIYQRDVLTSGNFVFLKGIDKIFQATSLQLPSFEVLGILSLEIYEKGVIFMMLKSDDLNSVFAYKVYVDFENEFNLSSPSSVVVKRIKNKKIDDFMFLNLDSSTLLYGFKSDYQAESLNIDTFSSRDLTNFQDFDYIFENCQENFLRNLVYCYNKNLKFLVINSFSKLPYNRLSFFKIENPYIKGSSELTASNLSFNKFNNILYFITDFQQVDERSSLDSSYFGSVSLENFDIGVAVDTLNDETIRFQMNPAFPADVKITRYDDVLGLKFEYDKKFEKMEFDPTKVLVIKDEFKGLEGSVVGAKYQGDEFFVKGGNNFYVRTKQAYLPPDYKYSSFSGIFGSKNCISGNGVYGYIYSVLSKNGVEEFYLGSFNGESDKENFSKIEDVNCASEGGFKTAGVRVRKDRMDIMVMCNRKIFMGNVDKDNKREIKSVGFDIYLDYVENFESESFDFMYSSDKKSYFSGYSFRDKKFRIFEADFLNGKLIEISLEKAKIDGDQAVLSGVDEKDLNIYWQVLDLIGGGLSEKIMPKDDDKDGKNIGSPIDSYCWNTENIICYVLSSDSYIHKITLDVKSTPKIAETQQFQLPKYFIPKKFHIDVAQNTLITIGHTYTLQDSSQFESLLIINPKNPPSKSHIVAKFDLNTNEKYPNSLLKVSSPIFLSTKNSPVGTTAVFKTPETLENVEFDFTYFQIHPTKISKFLGIWFSKPQLNLYSPNSDSIEIDLSQFYKIFAPSLYLIIGVIFAFFALCCGCCFYFARKFSLEKRAVSNEHDYYEEVEVDHSGISDHYRGGFDDDEEFKGKGNEEDFELRARGVSKI